MIIVDDILTVISVLTNPIVLIGYSCLLAVFTIIHFINLVPKPPKPKTESENKIKIIMPKLPTIKKATKEQPTEEEGADDEYV